MTNKASSRSGSRAHVCVIYTGGTLGMLREDPGNPASPLKPGTKAELEQFMPPNLETELGITYDLFPLHDLDGSRMEPVDSSDVAGRHWKAIANAIGGFYQDGCPDTISVLKMKKARVRLRATGDGGELLNDEQGEPIFVVDDDGSPVYERNADGELVLQAVTTADGQPVFEADDHGKPIEEEVDHPTPGGVYDGFVVLHGTDTMAYTSSALSFMLENLARPVVVTGSQLPISHPRTDAVSNFVNALHIAGSKANSIPLIPEVVIVFAGAILRGNRVSKMSSSAWQGFETPNYPALGTIGEHIRVATEFVRSAPDDNRFPFYVRLDIEDRVVDLSLFPGMQPALLRSIFDDPELRGAVLRTFGSGNAPGDPALLREIERAIKRGLVVCNITQCPEGMVEAGLYEASSGLLDIGVISGLDQTPEASLTKLMSLLANEGTSRVFSEMQIDLRGEQSASLFDLRYGASKPKSHDPFFVDLAAYQNGRLQSEADEDDADKEPTTAKTTFKDQEDRVRSVDDERSRLKGALILSQDVSGRYHRDSLQSATLRLKSPRLVAVDPAFDLKVPEQFLVDVFINHPNAGLGQAKDPRHAVTFDVTVPGAGDAVSADESEEPGRVDPRHVYINDVVETARRVIELGDAAQLTLIPHVDGVEIPDGLELAFSDCSLALFCR